MNKAISIRQPWAWAILHAGKDIENRSWYTPVRGRVWIHAGKKIDKDDIVYIESRFGIEVPRDLPTGGIVGSVEIVDCVAISESPWFFGKFGFVLKDPRPCAFVPCNGQLGFFGVIGGPNP
jgi:hypothetical protein